MRRRKGAGGVIVEARHEQHGDAGADECEAEHRGVAVEAVVNHRHVGAPRELHEGRVDGGSDADDAPRAREGVGEGRRDRGGIVHHERVDADHWTP